MKFTFDLTSRKECAVEADDRDAALAKVIADNPGYTADAFVDDTGTVTSIDICDRCGKQIFDDQVVAYDPEQGNGYCEDCAGASRDDWNSHSETARNFCTILTSEFNELIDVLDCEKIASRFNALKELGYGADTIIIILKGDKLIDGYIDTDELAEALVNNNMIDK